MSRTFLIRSLVTYNSNSDQSIPAKGLNLRFGQVVAVIDAHDNNWWRACPIDVVIKEGGDIEINMIKNKAGLIPSQGRFKRKLLKKLIRKVKWNEEDLEEKMIFAPFPSEYLNQSEYEELMKRKSKRSTKSKNETPPDEEQTNLIDVSNKFGSYKTLTLATEKKFVNSAIAYSNFDGPMVDSTESGKSASNSNISGSPLGNGNANVDTVTPVRQTSENQNQAQHNTSVTSQSQPQGATESGMNAARSNSSINTLFRSGLNLGIDKKVLEKKRAYEFVQASQTQLNPRPVMILGLLRDKLHSTLINYDSDRFAFVVPHTTREIRPNEVNGQDYHFITRKEMQTRIDKKEFIEAGVYKDNLYGTSVQAVRDIAEENKYALLDVSGGAISNLLSHDIDPIVILLRLNDKQWLLDSNQPIANNEQEAEQIFLKEKNIEEVYLEHCTSLIPVSSLETIEDITEEVIRVIHNETPIVWKKVADPTGGK